MWTEGVTRRLQSQVYIWRIRSRACPKEKSIPSDFYYAKHTSNIMVDSRCGALAAGFLFIWIFTIQSCQGAPQSYIFEDVQASYFYNGTPSRPVTRNGYVQVDVGNMADVLQYMRFNLTSTEGTNLLSKTAYRNVAASPNLPSDRTTMFVNTTVSSQELSYQITNYSLTPVISMRMDYANRKGGRELLPETNIFNFTVTLNSDRALQGASMAIQARRNTFGTNDSMNFTRAYAASGMTSLLDTDTDGFYDRVFWAGDLPAGDFTINFTGTTAPEVNFDDRLMYLDLDESQSYCIYISPSTFTKTAFESRFSRGPVREGIEMLQLGGVWVVRGFIKNIASNLTYVLQGWDLYQIGNPVPVLSSASQSNILPGETKNTEWYNTGLSGKPAYFSTAFNWQAVWNPSVYAGTSRSSMDMPILYEMDSWADGTGILQSNGPGGKKVLIAITTKHLGYSGIHTNSFLVNSTLPRLSSEGEGATTWTPSVVKVFYFNGTGLYDVTPYAHIETSDSDSGNGFVYASIDNISSAIGHYMEQNDNIILSYLASGRPNSANYNYSFRTNTTLVTLSGTPVTKTVKPYLIVPGVIIPLEPGAPGGGGGGAAPSKPYAGIVKESSDAYFVAANMVKVVMIAGVVDSGDKGIKDVKVLAYAPSGAELDPDSVTLRLDRNSTGAWEELALDRDFTIVDRGMTNIGKTEYREYLIKMKTPEGSLSERAIDMRNRDRIEVTYRTAVPFGTSLLLTRLFGYNYYEDKLIFEDAYIPVRREIGQIERLQMEESEWMQGEAVVGKPVKWTKTFRVYNPNNVSVEEAALTGVFQDSLDVQIGEAGSQEKAKLSLRGEGKDVLVNWYARMAAKERKTYILEANTPPTLETKRETEAIETNRTAIRLIVNMTLENFAKETYSNLTIPFPVRKEKILMVSDSSLLIEEDGDGVKLVMPGINGFEVKNIYIMYIETPPMMATALNAIKYTCTDSATLSILIVPTESEMDSYIETEVVGPEPNMITSHAEIMDLRGAVPYQEIKNSIRISLSSFPSGNYFVLTKFNKNFATILSDKKEFSIDCLGRDLKSISWIFVLAASLAIVGVLGLRVYRKRSYGRELADLRKKVKDI
jgi:hypothetical protein